MNNKKEMTKVQQYAVKAAREKAIAINKEMQSLLLAIAKELDIDSINETWGLSDDVKYLERQDVSKTERMPTSPAKTMHLKNENKAKK